METNKKLSVREWQKLYNAGEFAKKDRITQIRAGWRDWVCPDAALAGRLKRLASVLTRITNPDVLDHCYLRFQNICPEVGPLYDGAYIEPLNAKQGGERMLLLLSSPRERKRWTLYTERVGFETPEYACGDPRRMATYIDGIEQETKKATPRTTVITLE